MKRKGMRSSGRWRFPLFFAFLLVLFLPPQLVSAHETAYVEGLVERSRNMGLAKDPYWLVLLHYKQGFSGLRSLVDDPNFFLSPSGKNDSAAELEATIRAFFQPPGDEAKHPVCRFVARFFWLKEKLSIDTSKLPVPMCQRFNRILKDIQPESVSLIFPAAHINGPASMFGHTLLTVDTTHHSRLLAWAINYTAVTTENFGPLFALKAIVGLYPGYFSMMPYYTKLQEYNDIEQRDIWEYRLNFTQDEITRLLMHTYEMDQIRSDYYFFDENCSYILFFLLDAARPSLQLTDQCRPWVIPLDTIRVVEKNDLIAGRSYRASRASRIRYIASLLSEEERLMVNKVAAGEVSPAQILNRDVPVERKVLISDLAGEFLQYRHAKKDLTNDIYNQRFLNILRVRSELGGTGKSDYEVPVPKRPDEGHRSNLAAIGAGIRENDSFLEMTFRPAYHSLTDNDTGYMEGSQIIFTGIGLRYYFESERVKLHNVDLIDIVSISSRDDFFKPISWKVRTGLRQKLGEDGADQLIYDLTTGGGFAWNVPHAGLFYLMGEAEGNLGGRSEERWALGMGGSVGLIRSIGDQFKVNLLGREIYYALGDHHNVLELSVQANFAYETDRSIRAGVKWTKAYSVSDTEATLSWNIYF
jgi:hypothetical protein